ncbi:DUF4410 domain-containing protein [Cupriavidus pauculus]|uniref:DUF4410 domain-containing protein n=1 Tax=Cupriavidus pauculus TaxID=82633 RepID=A0A2N5C756_9BURK|nr:DUF4410 domain-containing protein [Cupriavidus pauculus]PLP98066.1 hypothetical protein CYJ10_23325 [Cupriavidus pauculus]
MTTTFQALSRTAKQLTIAAVAAASMMMAGGASATTMISEASVPASVAHVQADVVYVRGFDVSASQVKVDNTMMHRIKAMASGDGADSETQAALAARNATADEIVRQLQAKGLHAVRIDGPVPTDANALIVEGRFDKIDEGKQRRRTMIGLGAGKSDVSASVQVLYQPAHAQPIPLALFDTNADSGHMPGVAEMAGVGAAASHVATSVAASAGVHGATEYRRDSVGGEAQRVGDAVVKQVMAVLAHPGGAARI